MSGTLNTASPGELAFAAGVTLAPLALVNAAGCLAGAASGAFGGLHGGVAKILSQGFFGDPPGEFPGSGSGESGCSGTDAGAPSAGTGLTDNQLEVLDALKIAALRGAVTGCATGIFKGFNPLNVGTGTLKSAGLGFASGALF